MDTLTFLRQKNSYNIEVRLRLFNYNSDAENCVITKSRAFFFTFF